MLVRLASFVLIAALLTARPVTATCGGDCNGDGAVAINELVLGVGIALGSAPLSGCASFDTDGDGAVAINELVAAVTAALNGCGSATPAPTPTTTPGTGSGSGKVVFAGNDPLTFMADLVVINADGSGRTNLTNTDSDSENQPTWSPDGRHIAFSDNAGISVVDADGSNRHQVAAGGRAYPAWSPDGARIAFVGGATFNAIEVVDAGGANRHTVLGPDGFEYQSPTFSPDGSEIAFVSNRPNGGSGEMLEVFVMQADGTNVRRLTEDGVEQASTDWSPNGEIALNSSVDGLSGIYALDPTGGDPALLVENGLFPSWSRDGSRLVYATFAGLTIAGRDGTNPQAIPNTTFDDTAPDLD